MRTAYFIVCCTFTIVYVKIDNIYCDQSQNCVELIYSRNQQLLNGIGNVSRQRNNLTR